MNAVKTEPVYRPWCVATLKPALLEWAEVDLQHAGGDFCRAVIEFLPEHEGVVVEILEEYEDVSWKEVKA